ncbi:GNAT family N-acetyltransferase [Bordetella bronchialis]|uniref:GCN5 family acetyltransferase n=1 Tax=Bordetella bronchialis TaxID=463025 RepID=A0ABM6CVW0_9BORD|nr:GNAT family N-acetyltransferase [Bordetella bronchialis]ANN68263.1 GCN5 family acetyltransferase [Bordetella bronchialis]
MKVEDRTLRHAETEDDLRACFPVMHELRPHLRDDRDFAARVGRMRRDGYRLLAGWQGGAPVALAGYRLQENLVYGSFLYVDDLVVKEGLRGGKWGARLLREVGEIARREGCARLVLDTALSNALAQRFYFREGLLTGTMRFHKVLEKDAA